NHPSVTETKRFGSNSYTSASPRRPLSFKLRLQIVAALLYEYTPSAAKPLHCFWSNRFRFLGNFLGTKSRFCGSRLLIRSPRGVAGWSMVGRLAGSGHHQGRARVH